MPEAGLEPASLAAEDFKSSAYAIPPLRQQHNLNPGDGIDKTGSASVFVKVLVCAFDFLGDGLDCHRDE